MKINSLIVIVLLFSVTGCSNLSGHLNPAKNEKSVKELITYEYDSFEKNGWLKTAKYFGKFEDNYDGVIHSYRALYDSTNNLQFIQLYMTLMAGDWYFIDNVISTNDANLDFVKIDRQVESGRVYETFAITITKEQLQEFAKEDVALKVSGKRDFGIFTVSKFLSSSFLAEVKSYR